MDSTPRWLFGILKGIGCLIFASGALFVVCCLLWWWAWTNTGEMNRERLQEQVDTTSVRQQSPIRAGAGSAADFLATPAR